LQKKGLRGGFMRFFAFLCILAISFSHGRNLAAVRKDAFAVGVSKSDSAAEYDFISEITAKMKISRFRVVSFENASSGEKLLLEGKIDAIISRINYSPYLENKFLLSEPYAQSEISIALPANNNDIWTLADLSGKNIAFIPKEVSSEQILSILPKAKLNAARGTSEALTFLQKNEAKAIIASRQTLEAHSTLLRILPNTIAENNIVALFAKNSKTLQEEFNNSVRAYGIRPVNNPGSDKETKIKYILTLLNELKKEVEDLQKELK
jgi:ABC-type amino acid transport substrate-binding protein